MASGKLKWHGNGRIQTEFKTYNTYVWYLLRTFGARTLMWNTQGECRECMRLNEKISNFYTHVWHFLCFFVHFGLSLLCFPWCCTNTYIHVWHVCIHTCTCTTYMYTTSIVFNPLLLNALDPWQVTTHRQKSPAHIRTPLMLCIVFGFKIFDRSTDGILGQHTAMKFDWR